MAICRIPFDKAAMPCPPPPSRFELPPTVGEIIGQSNQASLDLLDAFWRDVSAPNAEARSVEEAMGTLVRDLRSAEARGGDVRSPLIRITQWGLPVVFASELAMTSVVFQAFGQSVVETWSMAAGATLVSLMAAKAGALAACELEKPAPRKWAKVVLWSSGASLLVTLGAQCWARWEYGLQAEGEASIGLAVALTLIQASIYLGCAVGLHLAQPSIEAKASARALARLREKRQRLIGTLNAAVQTLHARWQWNVDQASRLALDYVQELANAGRPVPGFVFDPTMLRALPPEVRQILVDGVGPSINDQEQQP